MALTTTTLAAAVAVNDTTITVASATSLAARKIIRVNGEIMRVTDGYVTGSVTVPVARALDGTVNGGHVSGSNVTFGDGSDFQLPAAGVADSVTYPAQQANGNVYAYGAAGAISLVPGVHMLIGTSVLAMTLAAPTKDQDGTCLVILANGAAAHTITASGGFSGAGSSYDILTMNGTGPTGVIIYACNGKWIAPTQPGWGGTLTNIIASVA